MPRLPHEQRRPAETKIEISLTQTYHIIISSSAAEIHLHFRRSSYAIANLRTGDIDTKPGIHSVKTSVGLGIQIIAVGIV